MKKSLDQSAFQPIENYGVIGDMRSVALVGKNGSIDWCCLPAFDSPSVFGAILDDRQGGCWSLAPAVDCIVRQMYLPDTNVLVTRFFADVGMAEVVDFMPVFLRPPSHDRPSRSSTSWQYLMLWMRTR